MWFFHHLRSCFLLQKYSNAFLQLLKSDFISLKMRNIPSESTKFTNEIDGRAMNGRRASNDKPERYDQKQLYQLCQQLSRQNRHLKRQVNDLRKLVASNEDNSSSMFFQQNQKQNYREINYECYKKKAIQILTSLKLLQNLYTERTAIDKKNRILESFMGKIKHGNLNHIDELLKLYGECLQGKEEDSWNIDQLQRQCSQYQNSILRRHIQKLSTTLFQSVKALKNNLQQVKLDIIENQEKIQQEIKYYCGKYVVDNLKVSGQPKQTKKIKKKKSKASNDQNAFEKVSWDKIVDQRSKIKQKQKLQPNVKQKIHQSLLIAESKTFGVATLLSNQQPTKPKIPKPQSKCNKQQITIIDQLQNSKYVGNSTSTPQSIDKSRNNAKNHSRNSISKHGYPSNEKSLNQSPRRKYSYFR